MKNTKIRQPIVTVCGHVDHGKTSLLDALRGSSVQDKEAGGITQKISFTSCPVEQLKSAFPLIEKQIELNIPGFLFIDTPGHAAFTNLRRRGGSLADLAILVIDINEGIKPQTAEVIQILKMNKVAFVIALNKIDKIHGWKTYLEQNTSFKQRIEGQPLNAKQVFNEKYLTLVGSLQNHGFDSDLFYNINDFTKKVALVPCSAKTGEGLQELILVLCGLSQKYLQERLTLGKDAKGIMLEIKKQQTEYIEAILYDGELSIKDEIAVAGFSGKPIITKIRVMEEILPLSAKFKPKEKVQAATGLRLQIVEKGEVLPGMPFIIYKNNFEEIEKIFKKELSEIIKTDKQGIIAKADSLGSLEALLSMLRQENIPVLKAGVGNINKADIVNAKANLQINPLDAVVLGFNISMEPEVEEIKGNVTILTDDVIYKLIENTQKLREEKRKEIEKERLLGLSSLGKVKVLHQHVFRNTNPAIFGIKVEAGKVISGLHLIDSTGEKVGKIKNMQSENSSVEEAFEGKELAVSIPGINFERRLKNTNINFLYSDISESQFRNFKKNRDLLSSSELSLLHEIAEIKRKSKADWGI
ncbi:translation initiation factor IF-2 [Candidatus Pacearchaeota archaeon]|nr:translation initiation factor IF-2 [Candidatus Pacearchaeota archaeon]